MMFKEFLKLILYIKDQLGGLRLINKEHVIIVIVLVLASCSEDKRLGFVDAEGKIAHIIKKAHSQPINRC